ncbi:MAG: MBL fold metallo-hydrolase [Deltaproteobacteria bacterium]|jgi:alkyl sulfatase BDS1-like metallo-beta-lactamase superfamily hydrolase|nr:MBL fold metallo-hydrolase [Deltaproteobacteria bacterium]
MFYNNKKVLVISLVLALYAGLVFAQEAPFISKSLSEDTVIGPNGAVTVADALTVSQLMGAEKKTVHEINKGVYHIRGWGIAHTIAIDAPNGWIIVDTGDSTRTAAEMRDRLEKKVGKKIKVAAILYTHSHYTDGTDAWLDEGTVIWGHEDLDKHKRADDGVSVLSGNFGTRALIQFGVLHPTEGPDAFPNILGFGPEKFIGVKSYRPPTKTFEDGKTFQLTIAGEPVEVAPNRTDVQDSVGFYFPKRKALVTNALGAVFMFNLYTLRGDMYRNPLDYVEAHDWALSKKADVLADIHGPGIKGKQEVKDVLESARDQMQLVHDQTLRMIAKGMNARQSAENVYMPMHLRTGREMYGQLESHVKQVYNGRVGWMGNDVYDINPLAVKEEAMRMVSLMGGPLKVNQAAGEAVEQGGFENWSWALKLTSLLLEIDPDDADARKIRAASSRAMGQRTASANARGFYITEALALENKLKLGDQPVSLESARVLLGTPDVEKLMDSPLEDSLDYIRYLVDPHKAEDIRLTFTIAVDGVQNLYKIELRNGVVIVTPSGQNASDHINVTRREWSEFVAGQRSLADGSKAVALFESVLERTAVPAGAEKLDEQLDDVVDGAEYLCDGGDH